jgi:hypothetical protein
MSEHNGYLSISGAAAKKMHSSHKPGQMVKLHVHGKIESMSADEENPSLAEITGPNAKKPKKGKKKMNHRVSVAVHKVGLADQEETGETSPDNESQE